MSTDAPDFSQFPYAGWVPTAVGRLSFRHIGETRHPTKTIFANLSTDVARYVLAYQRRPLSDVLFQSVIHYLCNVRGDFWFALTAISENSPLDDDDISGSIYIFKSREDWRAIEGPVRSAIKALDALRLSLDADRSVSASRAYQTIDSYLETKSDIKLTFFLRRSGEVYFSAPSFLDNGLEFASTDYASRLGHDFPKWVADQSYFFLRDCCHQHQHHSSSSDTILILQERDEGDLNWRKHIIFSLYHYVIRNKRDSDTRSLFQAQGILAYCNSFREICRNRLGDRYNQIPIFNDEALTASIDARAQEELSRLNLEIASTGVQLAKAANWRTFALALVALAFSFLAMLVQPRIGGSDASRFPRLNQLSDFVSEYLGVLVISAGFFLIAVWAFTSRGWSARWKVGRDILELSQGRRITTAFFIILAAAAVPAVLFPTIGAQAVSDIISMLQTAVAVMRSIFQ